MKKIVEKINQHANLTVQIQYLHSRFMLNNYPNKAFVNSINLIAEKSPEFINIPRHGGVNNIRLIRKIFSRADSPESVKNKFLKVVCSFIIVFVRPSGWYNALFKFCVLIKYLRYFSLKNLSNNAKVEFPIKRVNILNQMLSLLTRTGIPFHIPYEFNSTDIKSEKGVMYCSSHIPLIKVAIRAMIENNFPIDAIIAKYPTKNQMVSIWGMEKGVPALTSDNNVLLKVKSLLLKNARIALMIDDVGKSFYSPNSMKICQLTGSKVLFCFAKLNKNGTIHTWLENPPFPYCKTDLEIQENISYLKSKTDQIFREYTI